MNEKKNELMEQLEKAETIEEAKAIKSELEAIAEHEKLAEEKAAMIDSLKADEPVKNEREPKSLGEFAAKSLDLSMLKAGASKSAGTDFAFKAATDPQTSIPVTVTDQRVIDIAQRDLRMRSLFGAESISGTTLQYFEMGATEGSPASVAENAQKPQFHIPTTAKTATLQKIAGWYYETDELIEDNAFLKSSIDNRGLYELDLAVESYLATTLLATSGIQSVTVSGSDIAADDLFGAITAIKSATNYDADAIVINPADYQKLRLAKDANNQYYGGGYFYGAYGNTGNGLQPGLWGLNTVVTTSVEAGTALVGAFRAGASVITKSGDGVRVEVVTGDHDDRTNNRVTVIVEERLALATRIPGAFAKVSA